MNETDFRDTWERERPQYVAWGNFVTGKVRELLADRVRPVSVDYFLKIPPRPRVKELPSMLDKAFCRKKKYAAPYADITDKVGVRFVTLHTDDLEPLKKTVEECPLWTASKDRDYESERDANPELFIYQSVHYVVRSHTPIEFEGVQISEGVPCEIQLRTLLQHAYSELTHDTIYKPQTEVTAAAKRHCARAMALIEATDDYFLKVLAEIKKAEEFVNQARVFLSRYYRDRLGLDPVPTRINELILHSYEAALEQSGRDWTSKVEKFFDEKPYLIEQILARAQREHLFRQPAILIMYYLVDRSKRGSKNAWPLTPAELQPVYDDLNEVMPQ